MSDQERKREATPEEKEHQFRTPIISSAGGQARGNSDVFLQECYEFELLDTARAEMVEQKAVISDFHRLYYDTQVWSNTRYLGVHVFKCPFDLWIYQEILMEKRPDVIVECGTSHGGSALFIASFCDLISK